MRPMMTVAASPEPATSPTTKASSPEGKTNTSYQSPPTWPDPGTYRAATSAPAIAGSAEGTDRISRSLSSASSGGGRKGMTTRKD